MMKNPAEHEASHVEAMERIHDPKVSEWCMRIMMNALDEEQPPDELKIPILLRLPFAQTFCAMQGDQPCELETEEMFDRVVGSGWPNTWKTLEKLYREVDEDTLRRSTESSLLEQGKEFRNTLSLIRGQCDDVT